MPTMMGPDGWVDGTDGHNNGWGLSRYVQKLIICTVMRILVVMVHVGMQQLPELIIPVIRIQAFFLKNILLILVTMPIAVMTRK